MREYFNKPTEFTLVMETNVRERMIMKKRLMVIVLALAIAATATACGKKGSNETTSGDGGKPAVEESEAPAGSDKSQNGAASADVSEMLGRLYILNEDKQDSPITAVQLVGNLYGTVDDINGLEPSAECIRCIFSMNEWITVYPVTDIDMEGFRIFIFAHENDFSNYTSTYLSDHEYAASAYFQENEDVPGVKCSADAYINPEYNPVGYYDIVFFKVDQPIAVIPVKVYAEGELEGKDLKAIMDSERK